MAEEEEECEFQDAVGKQVELTGNLGQPFEVSLYTLVICLFRKTITLVDRIKNIEILILIDMSSSSNYIHENMVKDLGLKTLETSTFFVVIVYGSIITSHAICSNVK